MENRVTRSQDGKYRWAYEVPMMKNLTIFWTVIKVLFISLLIVIFALCVYNAVRLLA